MSSDVQRAPAHPSTELTTADGDRWYSEMSLDDWAVTLEAGFTAGACPAFLVVWLIDPNDWGLRGDGTVTLQRRIISTPKPKEHTMS